MANNTNELDELMNLDSEESNDINESMNDLMNLDSQIEEDVNENIADLDNKTSIEDDDMMNDLMNLDEDNSSDDDNILKKNYRQLVRKHHPDIITGQGASQNIIDEATKKLQEINEAYEMIKKERKI